MISVIIPTYDAGPKLSACLYGLRQQTCRDFEVIIVNDGGRRDEYWFKWSMPDDVQLRLLYLEPPSEAFRAGAARNLGLKYARGDRTLFVDQDCILAPDVVAEHWDMPLDHVLQGSRRHVPGTRDYSPIEIANIQQFVCGEDRRRFMFFPPYKDAAERLARGEYRFPIHYRFCWSFQLSVPTQLTRDLGGFWEEFGYGGEDQELCWRLQQAGCTLLADFNLVAYHIDHPRRALTGKHFELIKLSQQQPGLIRNGGKLPFLRDL
jgi:glycosyltransferase involved in cell wall biosynthesis